MNRREFLGATTVSTGILVAGCIDGDDEQGAERTTEEVIEAYIAALDNGDEDDLAELLHPDGRLATGFELSELTEPTVEPAVSIEEIAENDSGEDSAVFSVTTSSEDEYDEITTTDPVRLRRDDAEWRVWDDEAYD